MKWAALIAGLTCTPISAAAYADYICATPNESFVFVIDIAGQTITQSGKDPVAFTPAPLDAYPLERNVTASFVGHVDVPLPDHIVPGGITGFALITRPDGILRLIENYAFLSGDPANAFASVADIMALTEGIPCTATEAD